MTNEKEYTVEQLEDMILAHRATIKYAKRDDKLEELLYERQHKINKSFEWTPQNMEKLLHLDQKVMNCFEKMRNEAMPPLIKALEKYSDDKDGFEIKAMVTPFILVPDEDGELSEPEDGIESILHEMLDDYILKFNLKIKGKRKNLHLEKDLNWNIDSCLQGKLAEHYISYAIHQLVDHSCWSLADILRINHLGATMHIEHQNFEDVM
jgi:hypothetical protein